MSDQEQLEFPFPDPYTAIAVSLTKQLIQDLKDLTEDQLIAKYQTCITEAFLPLIRAKAERDRRT